MLLLTILLTIILSGVLYFYNSIVAQNLLGGIVNQLEHNASVLLTYSKEFEILKETESKNENYEAVEEADRMIHHYEESSKEYLATKNAYETKDWSFLYQRDLEFLSTLMYEPEFNKYFIEEQPVSNFTIRANFEERTLLKDTNQTPMLQNDPNDLFLATVYDEFTGSALEQWNTMTKRFGTEGFTYIYQMTQYLSIPITALVACFLFGSNLSSEMTKGSRQLLLTRVLPIHPVRLFFSKYTSGLFFSTMFTIIIQLFPLFLSLFQGGVGSLSYPILMYGVPNLDTKTLNEYEDSFSFITLDHYLIKALVLTIFVTFFLYTFYYLINLLIRNPSLSTIITATFSFLGVYAEPRTYNPFTYFDIHKIINGETALSSFNENIHFSNGILILGFGGILILLITYSRFRIKNNFF